MKYNQLEQFSVANGDGIRTVLWVQGCNHHCPKCQNPQTWNPNDGRDYTDKIENEILSSLSDDFIAGLTVSGGDPLFPDNRDTVTELCRKVHEKYPAKTIWVYTGYVWEEVCDLEIMKYINILVDGEYHDDERNLALPYCGSNNQRVIDVQKSLKENIVILKG